MSAMGEEVRPIDDQVAIAVERKLVGIAQQFDASLRDRVTLLLMAAAEGIVKVAELDLVRYEAEQGGHTLALWEEMAPVTGATVQNVNLMIAGATAHFPPPPDDESAGDLAAAFGPDTGAAAEEPAPKSTAEQIASLVAAVCSGMRRDVARLGDRLRNPTVMRDPWMLIQDLLEFRGRVRLALGELIYQVCSFIAEVERDTVIPGYVAELENSLLVRSATTNLYFLFRRDAAAGARRRRPGRPGPLRPGSPARCLPPRPTPLPGGLAQRSRVGAGDRSRVRAPRQRRAALTLPPTVRSHAP